MKLLYGARMACPWLSVAIQQLARQVHRWTAECDRRLHRLYCYVSCTYTMCLEGELSTANLDHLTLDAYVDSDLAGDVFSSKSTSGRFIELSGLEGRSMPLTWAAQQQGATAKATQEAEIVAMADGMTKDAIPIQELLYRMLRRPINMLVREDNEAAIVAARKGYSPALRHLPRVQRISTGSVHELFYDNATHDQTCGLPALSCRLPSLPSLV
jgi:hypothetical protein